MKKILGLLLFSMTVCFAMESDITNNDDDDNVSALEIIKGVLIIDPRENNLWYSPHLHEGIKRKLDLEIEELDPVVFVRVLDGDGSSKMPIYLYDSDRSRDDENRLSEFPQQLPLSILLGKKEGDIIIITSCDNVQIELTCNQKLYNINADFENSLQYLIKKFKKNPSCHLFDEESLIEKGIIEKGPKDKYKHGPNGYKF